MTETELFFQRTDRLASILRLSQREIAKKIGVSAGSYFGYRTGRNRITTKAWAKLERAERAAGIVSESPAAQVQPAGNEVRSSDPKELPAAAGEKIAGGDHFSDASEMVQILRSEIDEKNRQIHRLLGLLEAISGGSGIETVEDRSNKT